MKAEKLEKQTTKKCPNCNNTALLLFSTLNLKTCTDCDTDIPWYREKGQVDLYCCKPNSEFRESAKQEEH